MLARPLNEVDFPPASCTINIKGARSHGFEVQSSAASIAPSATSMCCQKPPSDLLLRAASRYFRMRVCSEESLLGPVPVENTIESFNFSTPETCSLRPSPVAPSPLYACHRECSPGALAIAATISPSFSIPISVPKVGMPRENSSVPSIGSMIIRARAPFFGAAELPPISSPERPDPVHWRPLVRGPFLPLRGPLGLPPCRPFSAPRAVPRRENSAAQFRRPRSQSPPAIFRTPSDNPLPQKPSFQSPVTIHQSLPAFDSHFHTS